jgi:hypothetical protein
MQQLTPSLITALFGFAMGIFLVLSLIEKPVWKLMWQPRAVDVPDGMVRTIHSQLKRVIHLLPPTMITTVVSLICLLVLQVFQSGFAALALAVLLIFAGQQILIMLALKQGIEGVDLVASDAGIGRVRDGLGALALLHHRGLLSMASGLAAQMCFLAL